MSRELKVAIRQLMDTKQEGCHSRGSGNPAAIGGPADARVGRRNIWIPIFMGMTEREGYAASKVALKFREAHATGLN